MYVVMDVLLLDVMVMWFICFFLVIRRPPISTRTDTRFPYTTLVRSDLHDALNAEIAKAWANCDNVKAMAAYGLGDPDWFTPPASNYRTGVDRPADWKEPIGRAHV